MRKKSKPVNLTILLQQCNAIRVAFSNQPVDAIKPGIEGKPTECPIAMTLANGWEVDVSEEIIMENTGRVPYAECVEICKRLKAAGFKGVTLKDATDARLYPNPYEWADRERPHMIVIPMTKTMDNFVTKFDNGEFPKLVSGE